MSIDTDYLNRCIQTLESVFDALQKCEPGEMMYDIYRVACVKEFELVLEQSGSLLKNDSGSTSPAIAKPTDCPSRTSFATQRNTT